MTITLNGTTGITTPDLTSTDDITANSSAVLTSASLPTALNATGSAPLYACRAWVNFNGTGTVAIRESGNVSSITDNGTGRYVINFTTSMPDANYSVSGTAWYDGVSSAWTGCIAATTSAASVNVNNSSGLFDADKCHYSIHR